MGNGAKSIYGAGELSGTRHIGVQILADQYGHVVHLGERDCSLQLEAKGSRGILRLPLEKRYRNRIGSAAVQARSVGYENAGTIEFLYDEGRSEFYFMEMNTRVQVEHPVTEFVTGVDIVKEQIKIAAGQVSVTQEGYWL